MKLLSAITGDEIEVTVTPSQTDETFLSHIKSNSVRDLPHFDEPVEAHDLHAVIVGNGPSAIDKIAEIRWRQSIGQTVIALNGVADALKERGVIPDYHVMIHASDTCLQFVKGRAAKKYLLASQCTPSLFDELSDSDVTLFHYGMKDIETVLPQRKYMILGGGITVGLTSMALIYAMGYRVMHLYGYDSSIRDGKLHAQEQPVGGAAAKYVDVEIRDPDTREVQKFTTNYGMLAQADAFMAFAHMLTEIGTSISVNGDGLLPAIVKQTNRIQQAA